MRPHAGGAGLGCQSASTTICAPGSSGPAARRVACRAAVRGSATVSSRRTGHPRSAGRARTRATPSGPEFIVHAAAQPSHDKAASIPYDDFDVNAVGTLNLLVAARDFARESPFCFLSTNKVYGDRPNDLPLVEHDDALGLCGRRCDGIDESLSIDQCLHSLFGASKVAADVLCQEYGRYFQMPVGIFRGGCLTGPHHAGVELHGFLNYIVRCAVLGKPYTIFGYRGKQVRDQIHAHDVAQPVPAVHARAALRRGLQPGRRPREQPLHARNDRGARRAWAIALHYSLRGRARTGDHICYISDLTKVRAHYPRLASSPTTRSTHSRRDRGRHQLAVQNRRLACGCTRPQSEHPRQDSGLPLTDMRTGVPAVALYHGGSWHRRNRFFASRRKRGGARSSSRAWRGSPTRRFSR